MAWERSGVRVPLGPQKNISRSVIIFTAMKNRPNITELIEPEFSKFPSKPFLLFLIFLLFATTGYFYIQNQSFKKEIIRIRAIPSPNPTYIYTTAPSSTPTPISYAVNNNRQTVNLIVPKYLDSQQEKETYKISFDKVGTNTKYYTSTDIFPKLIVEGNNYQFTLQISKEGQSNTFTKIPNTSKVTTNQFNNVTRIINPLNYMETSNMFYEKNKSYYTYTTDYSTNCTQWSQNPPACSSLQIYYNDQLASTQQVGIYASCISSDQSSSNCDKIISTLGIEIINK